MSTQVARGRRPVTAAGHFTSSHPLARLAGDRCTQVHGGRARHVPACGACWEHVVRVDAVFAAEWGLSQGLVADPGLVDEVAVERACTGAPVELTPAEVLAAAGRLRARGWSFRAIGARLGRDAEVLRRRLCPAAEAEVCGAGSGSEVAA